MHDISIADPSGSGGIDCIACRDRFCVQSGPHHPGAQIRHLHRGQHLAVSDENDPHAWIVVSGTAAVCTCLHDGRRQIVSFKLPGDLVPGMVTAPGSESWLEALNPCRICEVALPSFKDGSPEALRQGEALLRRYQEQMQHDALHIVTLGRLDGLERICLFLSQMARRLGIGDARSRRVSLPLSREDIADYLGLNAETVSRLLGRLKKSGTVTFLSPTEFLITDLPGLEQRLPLPTVEQRHKRSQPTNQAAPQGGRR